MPGEASPRVRTAEVAATLCLATDLGMGFPFEQGLRSTLVAMRLAERLGVDRATSSQTYYACLLMYSGCTTETDVTTAIFGGSMASHLVPATFGSPREQLTGVLRALPTPGSSPPARAAQIARRLPKAMRTRDPHLAAICEVAQMLADRLALPPSIHELFVHLTDRWDGKGPLRRGKADEIPLALRIVHVARDATLQSLLGGEVFALRTVRERAGHGFDPEVAACLADAPEILAVEQGSSAWDVTLACEPEPRRVLEDEALDDALRALGSFADLISPYLSGHSIGVAGLARSAAEGCRLDDVGAAAVWRAALLHDLGRAAVHPRIWQKPAALSPDEWEHVRLHPYQTERVLSRSPFLASLGQIAGAHHERLDRSGYHRGSSGAELPLPARILAAADAYHAMTEPRPHRDAFSAEEAADELAGEASAGRLDADAVKAVIGAAGQRAPRLERPAGLTAREAEVVSLLARGLQTKQIARELSISVKTADHHIQSSYRKMGVSTRAGATLFAMEHGLVAWGEVPIARRNPPS